MKENEKLSRKVLV